MMDMTWFFVITNCYCIIILLCAGYSQSTTNLKLDKGLKILIENGTTHHSTNNSYCNVCCMKIDTDPIGKDCGHHTMCVYPANKTGPDCRGYVHIQFTDGDRKLILDGHNTLRNRVAGGHEMRGSPGPQPSASNMRLMEWNDELATIAARWAAQCIFGNDVCRDTNRYPVGQNIAIGNFATNNDLSFVSDWYEAVDKFDKHEVSSYKIRNRSIGHYTQLVWSDSYQIGCARVAFQVQSDSDTTYKEHFICNYGPAGNIPEQPVYSVGSPCTACHIGTTCSVDYPALCTTRCDGYNGDECYNNKNEMARKSKIIKNTGHQPRTNFNFNGQSATSPNRNIVLSIPIYVTAIYFSILPGINII